jgi:protein phosphatase
VVQELVDAGVIRAEDAETHPDSNVIITRVSVSTSRLSRTTAVPVREAAPAVVFGRPDEGVDAEGISRLAAGRSAEETALALVEVARGWRPRQHHRHRDRRAREPGLGEFENTIPALHPPIL